MTKTERNRRENAAIKLKVLERRLDSAWREFAIVLQDTQEKSVKILSPFFGEDMQIGVVDSDGVVYNDVDGNTLFPEELYEKLMKEETDK